MPEGTPPTAAAAGGPPTVVANLPKNSSASFLAVLLVSAGFIGYERVTYQRSMTHDLRTLAEIIGNESTSALTFEDHDRAAEILSGRATVVLDTAA